MTTIQSKSMPKIFAKCGYNRNTSKCIMYGPSALGGAGFRPLYVTQGTQMVQHFLKHWRSQNTTTGKLLRAVLSWTQYQAGVSYSLLHNTDSYLPHVQSKFISTVRGYLSDIDGYITLDEDFVPQPLRKQDTTLMDVALNAAIFSKKQINQINAVRMHLGVTHLSEICNAQGTHIRKTLLEGEQDHYYTPNPVEMVQAPPGRASKRQWKRLLQLITQPHSNKLKKSLGKWLLHHSGRGFWKYYSDDTRTEIYERRASTWSIYNKLGTRLLHQCQIDHNPITRSCFPIDAYEMSNQTLHCTIDKTMQPKLPPVVPLTSWKTFVASKDPLTQEIMAHSKFSSIPDVISKIQQSTELIAVSDGSVKEPHMSFGWVLNDGDKLIAKGNGRCHGKSSSMRAEAMGMLGVTIFIGTVQEFSNYSLGGLQVSYYADNKALITRRNDHDHYETPFANQWLLPEADLIEEIFNQQKQHKITAITTHVKGHLDDDNSVSDLEIHKQMNVEADQLANDYYNDGEPSNLQAPLLPSCSSQLHIRGTTITTHYERELSRAAMEPQYIEYLQQKYQWTDSLACNISWASLRTAIKRIARPTLTTKICNSILPLGEFMQKTGHDTQATCPACGQHETFEHFLRCNHPERKKWKISLISTLRKVMESMDTKESIIETFNSALTEWLDRGAIDYSKYPSTHQNALFAQHRIGWKHVFTGHLSQEWEKLQGDLQQEQKVMTAANWAATIVTTVMQQVTTLWETRNGELHGGTTTEQNQKLLQRQKKTISKLLDLKPKCLARDHFVFPRQANTLLAETSTTKLANWISTRTQIIKNSIKQAMARDVQHTNPITNWFSSSNSSESQVKQWTRNRLLHDPYNKKKRHKQPSPPSKSTVQSSLLTYFQS